MLTEGVAGPARAAARGVGALSAADRRDRGAPRLHARAAAPLARARCGTRRATRARARRRRPRRDGVGGARHARLELAASRGSRATTSPDCSTCARRARGATALARMARSLATTGAHDASRARRAGLVAVRRPRAVPRARRRCAERPRRGERESPPSGRPMLIAGASRHARAARSRASCAARGLAYRALTRHELDVTDRGAVERCDRASGAWAVVNAAGYVRVDDAERDAAACRRAQRARAPRRWPARARRAASRSSPSRRDLVFDGEKGAPYVESRPRRAARRVRHGARRQCEARVLAAHPGALVVRTGGVLRAVGRVELRHARRSRRSALGVPVDARGRSRRLADVRARPRARRARPADRRRARHLAPRERGARQLGRARAHAPRARPISTTTLVRGAPHTELGLAARRPRPCRSRASGDGSCRRSSTALATYVRDAAVACDSCATRTCVLSGQRRRARLQPPSCHSAHLRIPSTMQPIRTTARDTTSTRPAGDQPRIVIIGAGPTGLAAGYRLRELGYRNFLMLEAREKVGGLASSETSPNGFIYDIGGHVLFSHYEYFDKLFDKLLGDEYQLLLRESWVWMCDRFLPYPVPEQHQVPAEGGRARVPHGADRGAEAGARSRAVPELRGAHLRRVRQGDREALHDALQLQGVGASAEDDEQGVDRRARLGGGHRRACSATSCSTATMRAGARTPPSSIRATAAPAGCSTAMRPYVQENLRAATRGVAPSTPTRSRSCSRTARASRTTSCSTRCRSICS